MSNVFEVDIKGFVKPSMLDLIIHELYHRFGMHCDRSYLDAITKYGAMIVIHCANEKSFIKIK